MIEKIREHIMIALKPYTYDDDFKEEMVKVCVGEYEKNLHKGLSKMDAYKEALKDFDDEYCKEKIDPDKVKQNRIIGFSSVLISAILVFGYAICNQVLTFKEFPWSEAIIFIPTIIFILVKLIFVAIARKTIKYELLGGLISILLYLPYLLIFVDGNARNDLYHYILTFPNFLVLITIGYMIKEKKVTLTSFVIILMSISQVASYYLIYNQNNYLVSGLKLIYFMALGIYSIVALVRTKPSKGNIISMVVYTILLIVFFTIRFDLAPTKRYLILIGALIVLYIIGWLFKSKLLVDYSFINHLTIMAIIVYELCQDIMLVMNGGSSFVVTYDRILLASLIIILLFIHKLVNLNVKKHNKKLILTSILGIATFVALANLGTNEKTIVLDSHQQVLITNMDYEKLQTIGYTEKEIKMISSSEYEKAIGMDIISTTQNKYLIESIPYLSESGQLSYQNTNIAIDSNLDASRVSILVGNYTKLANSNDAKTSQNTEYKLLTVTGTYYKNDDNVKRFYIKVNLEWINTPKKRLTDVISINMDGNMQIASEYLDGVQCPAFDFKFLCDERVIKEDLMFNSRNTGTINTLEVTLDGSDTDSYVYGTSNALWVRYKLPEDKITESYYDNDDGRYLYKHFYSNFYMSLSADFSPMMDGLDATTFQGAYQHQIKGGSLDWEYLTSLSSPSKISFWKKAPIFDKAIIGTISFEDLLNK